MLRSMIITALDTGMRRAKCSPLRFGDIDWKRQLIVLRGETTKSRKTRAVPIGTARLRAVLEWLRLDADGERRPTMSWSSVTKPASRRALQNGVGDGSPQSPRHQAGMEGVRVDGAYAGVQRAVFAGSTCTGTTCATIRVSAGREGRSRWRRCATSSGTRRSPRPSATTTRSSRTCRPPRLGSNAARHSTALRASHHRQIVKFLSRIRPRPVPSIISAVRPKLNRWMTVI